MVYVLIDECVKGDLREELMLPYPTEEGYYLWDDIEMWDNANMWKKTELESE